MTKEQEPDWQWGNPFEGWARNFVRRNSWRVTRSIGEYEDCLQECALVFARCRNKYRGKVKDPAHFMALFQRAVRNQFHIRAVEDYRFRLSLEKQRSLPAIQEEDPNASIVDIWESSSEELQRFLKTLADSPAELLELLLPDHRTREELERRWIRLCRIPGVKNPLTKELLSLLYGAV
jgi:DNA-directed RNA polymerase specialized sigma24 family protein